MNHDETAKKLRSNISKAKEAKVAISTAQQLMRGLGWTIDQEVSEACEQIDKALESYRRELGQLMESEP